MIWPSLAMIGFGLAGWFSGLAYEEWCERHRPVRMAGWTVCATPGAALLCYAIARWIT